jgi:hypothetical protein
MSFSHPSASFSFPDDDDDEAVASSTGDSSFTLAISTMTAMERSFVTALMTFMLGRRFSVDEQRRILES